MGLYRKILFSDPLFRHNITPEDSLWVYRKKYRPKWRCHRIPSAHKADRNTVAAPFFHHLLFLSGNKGQTYFAVTPFTSYPASVTALVSTSSATSPAISTVAFFCSRLMVTAVTPATASSAFCTVPVQ